MGILVSGYDVELVDEDKMNELIVDFPGPPDSPYSDVSTETYLGLVIDPLAIYCIGSMEGEGSLTRVVPT